MVVVLHVDYVVIVLHVVMVLPLGLRGHGSTRGLCGRGSTYGRSSNWIML